MKVAGVGQRMAMRMAELRRGAKKTKEAGIRQRLLVVRSNGPIILQSESTK